MLFHASFQSKFTLPPNLVELHVGCLPCSLRNIEWSPELKVLCWNHFPTQKLTINNCNFPTSLHTLKLGGDGSGSIFTTRHRCDWEPGIFPQNLRVLNVGSNLQSALQPGVLPLQLEELSCELHELGENPFPFDSKDTLNFPPNLKKIYLPCFFGGIKRNPFPKCLEYLEIGFIPARYREFQTIILPETTICILVFTFRDEKLSKEFQKSHFKTVGSCKIRLFELIYSS